MNDKQKLRDEFETEWTRSVGRKGLGRFCANGSYIHVVTHYAWRSWKASHAKYAPRWLPIDEAAKDGRKIIVWRPGLYGGCVDLARWNDDRYNMRKPTPFWESLQVHIRLKNARLNPPTHYMPIPDAPEVAT